MKCVVLRCMYIKQEISLKKINGDQYEKTLINGTFILLIRTTENNNVKYVIVGL